MAKKTLPTRQSAERKGGNPRQRPSSSAPGKTQRKTPPPAALARTRAPTRPQKFVTSHLTDTAFEEGLRAYAKYRDLGIAAATNGMVQAHVIKFVPPCRPEEVSKLHYHDVEFQMIYVLKGWIKSEFTGKGVHTFNAGSCWIQPPRIEHRVLDYSDDCEVLEIIAPAEFDTVTLD
jgi:mannose-6-phosphate isomerase-like protein (cupin superfamily)